MKISKNIYNSVKEDCKTILKSLNTKINENDEGKTGLKFMYYLLDKISHDRAYNNEHPAFKQGIWQRILEYDGREFCFYYENNCNDNHIITMLKNIKNELIIEGF